MPSGVGQLLSARPREAVYLPNTSCSPALSATRSWGVPEGHCPFATCFPEPSTSSAVQPWEGPVSPVSPSGWSMPSESRPGRAPITFLSAWNAADMAARSRGLPTWSGGVKRPAARSRGSPGSSPCGWKTSPPSSCWPSLSSSASPSESSASLALPAAAAAPRCRRLPTGTSLSPLTSTAVLGLLTASTPSAGKSRSGARGSAVMGVMALWIICANTPGALRSAAAASGIFASPFTAP
mmetsp:Transcript_23437/g.89017  ORF Transcript_23437/g.89017 Transcript_23437/m.89017 type:complete len:238 (-) Transcript_23437:510-1223(-)